MGVAGDLGVDDVLNVTTTSTKERIAAVVAMTGGRGADIVVDCSGVPDTFVEGLRMVRTGGVLVEAGTFIDMGPVSINPNSDICTRNVSVVGVGGETASSYAPAMSLMAANLGRYPLQRIVTHQFALDEAQQAVVTAQADEAMQVVINPNIQSATERVLL